MEESKQKAVQHFLDLINKSRKGKFKINWLGKIQFYKWLDELTTMQISISYQPEEYRKQSNDFS